MRSAALLLALAAACGSKSKQDTATLYMDPASVHGAWALLGLVPAGAERVIEIDVARLRQNESIGALVRAWGQQADVKAIGDLGFNPVLEADLLVMATFTSVEGDQNLVLARGGKMDAAKIAGARPDASKVDATTVVYGTEPWRAKVVALGRGEGASVMGEESFLRLRDQSVPPGAPGASVRATARFAFGRRVQLAGELGIDEMPGTASVWGDVADDVAVVGLFTASSQPAANRLAQGLEELYRRQLAGLVPGAAFEAKAKDALAKVVFHLGPKALGRVKKRFAPMLEAPEQR